MHRVRVRETGTVATAKCIMLIITSKGRKREFNYDGIFYLAYISYLSALIVCQLSKQISLKKKRMYNRLCIHDRIISVPRNRPRNDRSYSPLSRWIEMHSYMQCARFNSFATEHLPQYGLFNFTVSPCSDWALLPSSTKAKVSGIGVPFILIQDAMLMNFLC